MVRGLERSRKSDKRGAFIWQLRVRDVVSTLFLV